MEPLTVHVEDHTGVRHYLMVQHADAALAPVAFLRARAESYFRGYARTSFRASITDVAGRIVARAQIRDTGGTFGRICIEAW